MAGAVLSGLAAQALAAGLVITDLWSRSERMRVMVRGAGAPLSFGPSLALTAFGDAAAAVTPWRAGGELARVIGARASAVPMRVIVAVLSVETLVVYVMAAVAGAWLAARFGADWMAAASGGATISTQLVYVLAVATSLAAFVVVGVPPLRNRVVGVLRSAAAALAVARAIPAHVLVACVALSAVSLVARVAVLPALALSLDQAPPLGVLALASFALIHGQIAMPTPGGAGPIELAFLKGGVGVTEGSGALLGWWRLYVSGFPIVVGFTLGAIAYGRHVLDVLPRRWRPGRIRE